MDTVRPESAPVKKSKLARTFHKVINLRAATKIASNNGICKLKPNTKATKEEYDIEKMEDLKAKNKAIMEALLAKLFAGITSIKAAYAELQMAQHPYNNEAIQVADQAVVDELKSISEMKRSFLKKELDLSPQVTLMLAEIQEQQGLMKTYEITIKKLESEAQRKGLAISELKSELEELVSTNRSSEYKLKSSGPLSIFDSLRLSKLTPTHFAQFQQQTVRSIRSFVRLMIKEMESASWDVDTAIKFIEPEAEFTKQSHRCFAFESFVSKTMLEGFNNPNFGLPFSPTHETHHHFFDQFINLKAANPKSFLSQNHNASFCKFTRAKYLQLVHAKMECSLFGNLNQRKLIISGEVPDSPFFEAFAEMSMRVWLLHCLAFSYGQQVSVFQVNKNRRFSEVYMESVTVNDSDNEFSVSFTVVPGFIIGKTVFQSLVYPSPVDNLRRINNLT
ncbi:protein GRAVITROPIC IN THE LIGHT 1 [Argentina anserina]|uniref:protein GRAVITROPIC IN THE LIGHT 1 n=1 Tax=Argentina anserina TaxID=57926 RepID=UPI00217624E2|nr:protein GRAVITROPIC IN THE LIGHT 1 [Potentilla anserina]